MQYIASRVSDRPVIDSRTQRLAVYLSHNSHQLLVDAAILLAWMVGSAALFRWLALPPWLHYLVLFLGVVVYSQVTPNWERPYSSPTD